MVLKILESDYNANVYLFYAVEEPDTINIMCASEYLMLPSASLIASLLLGASAMRPYGVSLRLLCVCTASDLRPSCV